MIEDRLRALRTQMAEEGLSAYIIFGSDPHASEYVPPRWRTRAWISGFSGSAGTVVVTEDSACLWTDSRYYLQAERELSGSEFILFKEGLVNVEGYTEYLIKSLSPGCSIGSCATEISIADAERMEKALAAGGIGLTLTDDLLDRVWTDRPALPQGSVRELSQELTGSGRVEKIEAIRSELSKKGCDTTIIASLDDIAWIMNLRGSDIAYNPVFLSFLLITGDTVSLFMEEQKLSSACSLQDDCDIYPYGDIYSRLPGLLQNSRNIYLSSQRVSKALQMQIPSSVKEHHGTDISTSLKAVKNSTEVQGFKTAHLQDGVAMASFLCWLDAQDDLSQLDECSLAERLLSFRELSDVFITESFAPIAGFSDHGASCHYSATEESAYRFSRDGLLVLDTGGQYEGGTTDITRTLCFGRPTDQQIDDYTLVLKGHLALKRQLFPEGTCGYQIDTIARAALWNRGLAYSHGTGHGVGHMLSVHEGPQRISPHPNTTALVPGMVVSNEPGLYREGAHGIRIENLVLVVKKEQTGFGQFLGFEDLTLCPYERRLINTELLDQQEIDQIDRYHRRVYEEISSSLSEEARVWLKEKTSPIG